MSGFVAIINTNGAPVDRRLLEKLTTSLHFCGPDRSQVWVDDPVGLGHTLFRTTDEALYENQPATLDEKVWITGCIRIDARKELINKLGITDKIRLNQTPDSVLVLHAYRTWGEKCLEHLLGDFAFALWDGHKQLLFCAKDHFGMRQLYYSQVGNTFIVSNSIHCLHQHPAITKRLNKQAIGDFLLFGDHTWMDKAQTSFADIQSLLPAHSLILKRKVINIQRYWDIPADIPLLRYRKDQEYLEHFQDIFRVAVSDRLRNPRIVISLSGGMDSSGIAATIREIEHERSQTLELYGVTVLYDSIHTSDERHYVELVSQHLNLPTHYIDGGKYPLMSPPVQTTRPVELYQPSLWLDVERIGSTMGRVMLIGEAGDNLLAFSSIMKTVKDINPSTLLITIYRLKKMYGVYPGFGTGLLTKLNQLSGKSTISSIPYPIWINPEFEVEFELKQRWAEYLSWQPPSSHPRYSYLYGSLFRPDWSTDDCYMHNEFSVPEKRDPFLDTRLVEFVASLPALPWLFKKHILRRSMVGKLPGDIIERPKTLLGPIHRSLIKQANTKRINEWPPKEELLNFIDRQKIPLLDEGLFGAAESYLNLRPFLLNRWVMGLS